MRTTIIAVFGLLVFRSVLAAAETGIIHEVENVATQTINQVDITTKNGVTYTNCKITRVDPNSITVFHANGIAKIPFTDMPDELQAKYQRPPAPTAPKPAVKLDSSLVSTKFEQIGYFKNKAKNRIFTISYKKGTSESEIRAHANKLMNTPGRMTAAYFYPEGSRIPADGVTLAKSLFEANNVLYETPGFSKWCYVYMRYFNGKSEFVDCVKNPKHDLCRKKD